MLYGRVIFQYKKNSKRLINIYKNPQPDINAQDSNDNWNTALHLAIQRNELMVVSFLLCKEQTLALKMEMGKRLRRWMKNVIMWRLLAV
jgi:hypothetical protein